MPSHPNGRIKTKSASKQPQVGVVHEVQMKQRRRRRALGPLRARSSRITLAAGLIGIHSERLKSEYELLIYRGY